ncbi:hypothetical protein CB473P3_00002 [Enterocloster phage CB473P3]|nr:hypothetical protein CB473P3_00002 [Enterocloster phage CB473P3]
MVSENLLNRSATEQILQFNICERYSLFPPSNIGVKVLGNQGY